MWNINLIFRETSGVIFDALKGTVMCHEGDFQAIYGESLAAQLLGDSLYKHIYGKTPSISQKAITSGRIGEINTWFNISWDILPAVKEPGALWSFAPTLGKVCKTEDRSEILEADICMLQMPHTNH